MHEKNSQFILLRIPPHLVRLLGKIHALSIEVLRIPKIMVMVSKLVKCVFFLLIFVVILILTRILGYREALPPWEPLCTECGRSRQLNKAHIPKHIHQVFFFITDKELPKKYLIAQTTWKDMNPGFVYTLWNTSMIKELIKHKYPDMETLYNSYDHWVKRADMAR